MARFGSLLDFCLLLFTIVELFKSLPPNINSYVFSNLDLKIKGTMSICKFVLAIIPLLLVFHACEADQKLSTKECEELGFTGLALCSDCHTFAEYTKDQGMHVFLYDVCAEFCANVSFFLQRVLVFATPFRFHR